MVLGTIAVAALPAAIAVSERTGRFSLLEAGFVVPPAALVALVAILLGRRGRRRQRLALNPVRGVRAARAGRLLGWLGLYLAATGALALAVYWYETHLSQ